MKVCRLQRHLSLPRLLPSVSLSQYQLAGSFYLLRRAVGEVWSLSLQSTPDTQAQSEFAAQKRLLRHSLRRQDFLRKSLNPANNHRSSHPVTKSIKPIPELFGLPDFIQADLRFYCAIAGFFTAAFFFAAGFAGAAGGHGGGTTAAAAVLSFRLFRRSATF